MKSRMWRQSLNLLLSLVVALPTALAAQENQAKRLSSIVGVAVEEYSKAFDDRGRLILPIEYEEATTFLADARLVAGRLTGYDAPRTRAVLDTMIAAVAAKLPPAQVRTLHVRLLGSLGAAGAMDMPTAPVDAAAGPRLYAQKWRSCQGIAAARDGPAGQSSGPQPPPIGVLKAPADLTPPLACNVMTVGVRGTSMPAFGPVLSPQDSWN